MVVMTKINFFVNSVSIRVGLPQTVLLSNFLMNNQLLCCTPSKNLFKGTQLRDGVTVEVEREPTPSSLQDLNPLPLEFEACAQPLCYFCSRYQ